MLKKVSLELFGLIFEVVAVDKLTVSLVNLAAVWCWRMVMVQNRLERLLILNS